MTMFKLASIIMAFIIAIACPPLAIPLIALAVVLIDKHRKEARAERRARDAFLREAAEAQRYRALRSI